MREHIIEARESVWESNTWVEVWRSINAILEVDVSWVIQTEAAACVKSFVVFEEMEKCQQECGAEIKGWSGRYDKDQIMQDLLRHAGGFDFYLNTMGRHWSIFNKMMAWHS